MKTIAAVVIEMMLRAMARVTLRDKRLARPCAHLLLQATGCIAILFLLGYTAVAQIAFSGTAAFSGESQSGFLSNLPQMFFAALPVNWVDNTTCNPPGGVFDTTVILGTTNNIGPNDAGEAVGQPYALTPAGLVDAMDNWRDNADNASQTPHFADKWWLIEVPAGSVLVGNTFDDNGAVISLPGKNNGNTEPAKCLVIQSTTPLPSGQMVCGHGLPGFGGARNPGCTSPNDRASMWTVELEGATPGAPLSTDGAGIHAGADLSNPSFCPNSPVSGQPFCWTNHVVVRDVEITAYPGSAQSGAGKAFYGYKADSNLYGANPCSTATPCIAPDHIGLDRYYIHGWDPGDPGQPAGACSYWTNTGTVTTSASGSNTLVTRATGTYYGMTFAAGSPVTINGSTYTIVDDGTLAEGLQNGTQNKQFVVSGTGLGAGTYSLSESNPPWKDSAGTFHFNYGGGTPVAGCGDDMVDGVVFETDYGWRQNGYIEKIHWWQSESHASLQGFSKGPYKDVNNWEEGGSGGWFNGGGPVDQNGGPEDDDEIRRNYQGRDLNYKYLTGGSGNSPGPPFGCGPISTGPDAANTCPMSWAVKNTLELKLGVRVLIDGNIIENSWADGQTGWDVVTGARTCSGGASCGIFDPVSGLPLTAINNVRFSNNWFRNAPSFATTGAGSNITPGDGGGISLAQNSMDYINNLGSNINDTNQNGNPNYQWAYGGAGDKYTCNMSYTGTGPYTVVGNCMPVQIDNSGHILGVSTNASGQVQVFIALRQDPILCPAGSWSSTVNYGYGTIVLYASTYYQSLMPGNSGNSPSSSPDWWSSVGSSYETACQNAGQTLVINATSDIPTGWAGTYTMGASYQNWNPDGTGGTGGTVTSGHPVIVSNEAAAVGANQTLCNNSTGIPATCSALLDQGSNTDITFASQGSRILNLSVGSGVYAYNCSASGYAVGGTPSTSTYAIAPTTPASLNVYYQVATQPAAGSATCTINNIAGSPQNVSVQNNTFLSPARFAIQTDYSTQLYINNWFFNNVFADNDPSYGSDLFCNTADNQEGSGSAATKSSFACWDPNTFEFYGNVLAGRNCSYWNNLAGTCAVDGSGTSYGPAIDPLNLCTAPSPSYACNNWFPQGGLPGSGANGGVNCLGVTPDSGCLGYSGFMSGSPTVTFPPADCAAANAPYDCPLMSLPWANNFVSTDVSYLGSSSYQAAGVNTTQLNNAMTQTRYVCPTGANCGPHGPYPD